VPCVQTLRVTLRDVFHQLRAAGRLGRREQQMHVVCHQAIRVHLAIKLSRVRAQDVKIRPVIRFAKETVRATVAPLNDVDGDVRDDQTGHSRHIRETAKDATRLTALRAKW
jgi:hypothetical protein